MKKRVALVTGASKGIGKQIALSLLKEGYYVIINCRNDISLNEILSHNDSSQDGDISSRLTIFSGDFTSTEVRGRIHNHLIKNHNELHVLINNIPGFPTDSFNDFDAENTLSAFNNKLITYIDSMQCFSKIMSDGGRIINIVGNTWKYPSKSMFSNSSVNAAIVNASKNSSFYLAKKGITVNCIHPGFIETDRFHTFVEYVSNKKNCTTLSIIKEIEDSIPISRIGSVSDISALVVFLCSASASYITGQQISVDGGIGDCLF